MKKKQLYGPLAAACAMVVLIIDGKTALNGAADGIALCLQSLIPSLFPFFILSTILTSTLAGQSIRFLQPVAKLCRIPPACASLIAVGFLGGYPVGAQNVAMMHRKGFLSPQQASRMIVFCNNAGPSFLFGILGSMFSDPRIPWILWIIHIVSALLVGIVLPGDDDEHISILTTRKVSLPGALESALKTMALVCGWVVISKMVLAFLRRWFLWLLPNWMQILISGMLELSNGCILLKNIPNEGLRFIMAAAFLALGGICVTLQTASVTEGISMDLYFPGKLLQCCFSIAACSLLQFLFPAAEQFFSVMLFYISAASGIIMTFFLRFQKNSSRISVQLGV